MAKLMFTPLEKKTLLDTTKRYSTVIENKKTDGATSRLKDRAWESIAREYNANPRTTREVTAKQLRRLWMNMKQRQRTRQMILATGGLAPGTNDVLIEPDISSLPGHTDPDVSSVHPCDNLNHIEEPDISSLHPCNNLSRIDPDISSLHPYDSTGRIDHDIMEANMEYRDRRRRAEELHQLEIELLNTKIREAVAKAKLAELLLRKEQNNL